MAFYTIYKSDGTAINVNDNAIDNAYYNPTGGSTGTGLGVQLIGRNTISNSAIIAQSLLQSTENFASSVIPSDSTSLLGQLWFNKASSTLNVKSSTAGSGATNWEQIVTVNSSGTSTINGNLIVTNTVTSTLNGNATTASNAVGNSFFTAGTGTAGTENDIGVACNGYNPAYLYNNSTAWGLYSASGGSIIDYNRSTNTVQIPSFSTNIVSATEFIGAGTGLTGTAAGLSIGGNAATATNVAYSGLTGTVPTWNQNTTGSASYATNAGNASYATNAGSATNATNATYATTSGEANTLNISGTASTFNWTGLGGQPSWLWGGNTPSTMDVYNPSNFSVNYANSAGSATSATNATNATNATYATNVDVLTSGSGNYNLTLVASIGGNQPIYVDSGGGLNWDTGSNLLSVSGNITASGTVTGTSDARLKTNWKNLPENYLENLAQVQYGTYDRTDIVSNQAGVSAQDMQKLLPQVVLKDGEGYLSMAYGNAAMVSVIELTKRVLELEAIIAKLLK